MQYIYLGGGGEGLERKGQGVKMANEGLLAVRPSRS